MLGRSLLLAGTAANAVKTFPWSPTDCWVDGLEPSTMTIVNGAVSQWNDNSGFNRHLTQSDANRRGTYSAAAGGIQFSRAASQVMTAPIFNTNNVISMYAVVTFNENVAYQIQIYNGDSGFNGIGPLTSATSTTQANTSVLAGGVALVGVSPAINFSYPRTAIIGLRYTPSAGTLNFNGARSTFAATPNRATSIFSVGDSGIVHEAVAISTYISNSLEDTIVGYMAWRHDNQTRGLVAALPSGHPYKNAAPTP